MAYDLLIKNGTVIDGTGAPRYHADVAMADGKVAEVGKVKESAKQIIDASDLIVAPGFVDPHTHYDAQICWDELITCSSWHGVTSTVMGNCGVGVAPCKPQEREVTAWDLVNVEGIPFDVLSKGVNWEWETFPQYIETAACHKHGINIGFLAPLSPFRQYVMGPEAAERQARPEEIGQISKLLRDAVAAGAFGWSTSKAANHVGFQGKPLSSRLASDEELICYAGVLKELNRGLVEFNLNITGSFTDYDYQILESLLNASGRPVTWLTVQLQSREEVLKKAEPLIRRGGIPQVSAVPIIRNMDMRTPGGWAAMPSFARVFNKPLEEMKRVYADAEFRTAFKHEYRTLQRARPSLERTRVEEVKNPALKKYEGMSLDQVAKERGTDIFDAFFDVTVEDNLECRFTTMPPDEERIDQLFTDPRTLIGLSDGGAHVDAHCEAGYTTYLLGHWVRGKQVMSLERAINCITAQPAKLFGIPGRGWLAPGMYADVTIFDYNTVDTQMAQKQLRDLPGGGARFVMTAQGIEYTIVNGEVLYEHGRHTGALPGQVLRSQPQC